MSSAVRNVTHVSRVNSFWGCSSIDLFCGSGAPSRRRPGPQRSTKCVFEVRQGSDIAEHRAGQDASDRGMGHAAGQCQGSLTDAGFGHRRAQRPRNVLRDSSRWGRVDRQLSVWPGASGHVLGGWSNAVAARHHPTIAPNTALDSSSADHPYHAGAFTHQHGWRITDGPAPQTGCAR